MQRAWRAGASGIVAGLVALAAGGGCSSGGGASSVDGDAATDAPTERGEDTPTDAPMDDAGATDGAQDRATADAADAGDAGDATAFPCPPAGGEPPAPGSPRWTKRSST